jgi:hypothetical protein
MAGVRILDQNLIPDSPDPNPHVIKLNLTMLTPHLLTKVILRPVLDRPGVRPGVVTHNGLSGKERSFRNGVYHPLVDNRHFR